MGSNTGFFGRALPCPAVYARANTAPGEQRWRRDRPVWRGMRGVWPQPQVAEDLLDDVGLVNTRNDAHRAPTPGTQQRIGRIDFPHQLGPALLEKRRARRWGNLDGLCGRCVLS